MTEKGKRLTNIFVRAGIMGNKDASEKIHQEIQRILQDGTFKPICKK